MSLHNKVREVKNMKKTFYFFLILYIIIVLLLNSVFDLSNVLLTVLFAIFVGALVIYSIAKRSKGDERKKC